MRNLVLMLLLGAAALASWYWSRPLPITPESRSDASDTPLGYYLRGARLHGTDEAGRSAYDIRAELLEERPDDDTLLLDRVQVEYYAPDRTPWLITAGQGATPKDRSEIELSGGVELRNEPADGSAPVRIKTDALRFEPGTSTVESDHPVDITVGDWRLEAGGIRTRLKDDLLELESDVHGKFSP